MFDSCVYVDSTGPSPEFYHSYVGTTRKTYKCTECGDKILPGSTYERVWAKWEGITEIMHTCQICLRIRSSLFPSGWEFGSIWEAIHEEYCGDWDEGECICRKRRDK